MSVQSDWLFFSRHQSSIDRPGFAHARGVTNTNVVSTLTMSPGAFVLRIKSWLALSRYCSVTPHSHTDSPSGNIRRDAASTQAPVVIGYLCGVAGQKPKRTD